MAGYLQVMYEKGVTKETADKMMQELVTVADYAPQKGSNNEDIIYFSNDLLTIMTNHISEETATEILFYGKDRSVTFADKIKLIKTYATPKGVKIKDVTSSATSITDTFVEFVEKYDSQIDRFNGLSYEDMSKLVGFCYKLNYVFNNGTDAEIKAQVAQLLVLLELADGDYWSLLKVDLGTIKSFVESLDVSVSDATEITRLLILIATSVDITDVDSWLPSGAGAFDNLLDYFL